MPELTMHLISVVAATIGFALGSKRVFKILGWVLYHGPLMLWHGITYPFKKEPTFDEIVDADWEEFQKEEERHGEELVPVKASLLQDQDDTIEMLQGRVEHLERKLEDKRKQLREKHAEEVGEAMAGSVHFINGKPPQDTIHLGGWDIPIPENSDYPRISSQNIDRALREVWGGHLREVSRWGSETYADGGERVRFLVTMRRDPPHPFDW